jgi:hypothetical protein
VQINDLINNITIIPIPLAKSVSKNTLNFPTTEWGEHYLHLDKIMGMMERI